MNTKFGVFASRLLSKEELFTQGHRACQGCAPAVAMRLLGKALGRNMITVNATGCMEIICSPYPYMAWDVPWIHVAFENNSAVASWFTWTGPRGVSHALSGDRAAPENPGRWLLPTKITVGIWRPLSAW